MSITILQIQSLLENYQRQNNQSKVTETKDRHRSEPSTLDDKVLISAEAKRKQIYEQTAQDVLQRLMSRSGDKSNKNQLPD